MVNVEVSAEFSLHDLWSGKIVTDSTPVNVVVCVVTLVSYDEEKLCLLVEEAGSRGVPDSGCSKSVAVMQWVGNYSNAESPDFSKGVKLSPSSEVYQFGG